jgi:hypothetical protein
MGDLGWQIHEGRWRSRSDPGDSGPPRRNLIPPPKKPRLRSWTQASRLAMMFTALTADIILAIMTLPFIISITRDVF